jgi:hypothetical protein
MDERQMTQEEINEQIEAEMVVVRQNNQEAVIDGIMFLVILFNLLSALKFLIYPLLFV